MIQFGNYLIKLSQFPKLCAHPIHKCKSILLRKPNQRWFTTSLPKRCAENQNKLTSKEKLKAPSENSEAQIKFIFSLIGLSSLLITVWGAVTFNEKDFNRNGRLLDEFTKIELLLIMNAG